MVQVEQQILADYVRAGSEAAFRDLVARYSGLVYSVAVRRVGGDAHRAQEIAQLVFTDLARKAGSVPTNIPLSGWLHRHTCFVASNLLRSERRRVDREQAAVRAETLVPRAETAMDPELTAALDEAVDGLAAEDRWAVALRFYESLSFPDVGERLGVSEDAARMRVNRALTRLRSALADRGIQTTTAALAVMLGAEVMNAAPPALGAALAATALAARGAETTLALKLLHLTTLMPSKWSVAALIAATAATSAWLGRESANADRRRAQVEQERLSAELTQLRDQASQLSTQLQAALRTSEGASAQLAELAKLRAEVTQLRQQERARATQPGKTASTTAPRTSATTTAMPERLVQKSPFQIHLVTETPDDGAASLPVNAEDPAAAIKEADLIVQKAPLLDASSIRTARVDTDPLTGKPQIHLEFNEQGRAEFQRITRENVNKRLAMSIGGESYSAPIIRSEISGGIAMITGSFNSARAQELVDSINAAIRGTK